MNALRQALKQLDWRRTEKVVGLDDYGVALWVRNLSEAENSELIQAWMLDENGDPDATKRRLFQARLIQVCVSDESGSPVFIEGDSFPDGGLDEILNMPAELCENLGNHCLRMLGMNKKPENAGGN